MKDLKNLFLSIIITLCICLSSCDDSGVTPPTVSPGTIVLKALYLKPLNPTTDGLYQLWVMVSDTVGSGVFFKNLGKFNTLDNGNLVDSAGSPRIFSFGTDTLIIPRVKYALVTVEQPNSGNVNPGPSCIMAGPLTVYRDSISGALRFNDTLALGTPASVILSVSRGLYILKTNTNPGVDCKQGLWYCDTNDVPSLPDGINLRTNGGWVYEGWVVDNSTQTLYNTGKFFNRDSLDSDGAGLCSGPNQPTYHAPGQDWTLSGCEVPPAFASGRCGVFVTLTPVWRDAQTPFPLKIFWQPNIDPSLGCGQQDNVFCQRYYVPYGRLNIFR